MELEVKPISNEVYLKDPKDNSSSKFTKKFLHAVIKFFGVESETTISDGDKTYKVIVEEREK